MKDAPAPSDHIRIFSGCFLAFVSCAFGFMVRSQAIGKWQAQFNLSGTDKGDILTAGSWPFAFSIFFFSFIIDKLGCGRAAAMAAGGDRGRRVECNSLLSSIQLSIERYVLVSLNCAISHSLPGPYLVICGQTLQTFLFSRHAT